MVPGLALIGFWLAVAPGAIAQPAAWGLPQLMQSLAQVKFASAGFTERKTLAVLNSPLVATGTLTYTAPDMMQKITTAPVPERFTLDRGEITMTGAGGQTQSFALNQDPRIGGPIEGILATLAGDLPALNRLYTVQFSGAPSGWQIVLQPRDPRLAQFISWIRIAGSFDRIGAIDTQNANGDHSEMTVAEDAR
jgi:hypothetical protein